MHPDKHIRRSRRKATANIKKSRTRYLKANWSGDITERHIGMATHTATQCSCVLCGNPRKYFNEKSVQEKRHLQVDITELP